MLQCGQLAQVHLAQELLQTLALVPRCVPIAQLKMVSRTCVDTAPQTPRGAWAQPCRPRFEPREYIEPRELPDELAEENETQKHFDDLVLSMQAAHQKYMQSMTARYGAKYGGKLWGCESVTTPRESTTPQQSP